MEPYKFDNDEGKFYHVQWSGFYTDTQEAIPCDELTSRGVLHNTLDLWIMNMQVIVLQWG